MVKGALTLQFTDSFIQQALTEIYYVLDLEADTLQISQI